MTLPFTKIPLVTVLLWAAYLLFDTVAQVAFKWGADGLGDAAFTAEMLTKALTLPGVWLAIAGYAATFFVWMLILKVTPLSRAFPMTGMAYVTVPAVAWLAFGETIDLERATGIALIIAGVIALGSGEKDHPHHG